MPGTEVPDYVDDADIGPILGEGLRGELLARWLAARIGEIERALGTMPSIGIFVASDERIDPLVSDLRPLLAERKLDIVGCKEGRIVGAESQIRVFDVQYIKGLEFEAVLFVGVDELMSELGDLFDKFFLLA